MPIRSAVKKVALKKVSRDYGIRRLIKGREATLASINELTKEVGLFIKPFNYHSRGSFGDKMKKVIERNRATDDGFTVARKRSIFVKGLKATQVTDGGQRKEALLPYGGCHPACLALYQALKAIERKNKIKLNPRVCRMTHSSSTEMFHSTVVFELDGKYYEANPFHSRWGQNINEIKKEDALSRRYVSAKPISYRVAKLEGFSQRAVKELLDSESKFQI